LETAVKVGQQVGFSPCILSPPYHAFCHHTLKVGQQVGLSGIPLWTTDIGGYSGGNPDEPSFQQMLAWGSSLSISESTLATFLTTESCTVPVSRQQFALEHAIAFHAFAPLEALTCV
jgi:hypothetical protein